MWKLRKLFWNGLFSAKFRANKPRVIPEPPEDERRLCPVRLRDRYPSIPISNIPVADHLPADETDRFRIWFTAKQAQLYRLFPPNQADLPEIDADPFAAVTKAYPASHRKLHPPPDLPKELAKPIDLGELAVAGPYACYLQRVKPDEPEYEWDLRHLAGYEHHAGLRSLAVRVLFRADGRRLDTVEIECELGRVRPGDADWALAQKIALCAVTNDLSIVRHFDWIHLVAVSTLAIVTRNNLPPRHPLRRLLWPHTWGTQYSNELVTNVLVQPGGDFETVFSFTHDGLCKLLSDGYERYDIRVIDPGADAERRGVSKDDLDLPSLDNRLAHWDVMFEHAKRYLKHYYPSDEDLAGDEDVQDWIREMHDQIPHGIYDWLGKDLGVEDVARLVAGFVYLGSVEHEVLGTGLWNYQLWHHVQPTRLYGSGRRESIDVYQRLVNYNFILNVHRTALCTDFSYLGLDDEGKQAFRTFKHDLDALQARVEREPFAAWKVSPRILESGVNG